MKGILIGALLSIFAMFLIVGINKLEPELQYDRPARSVGRCSGLLSLVGDSDERERPHFYASGPSEEAIPTWAVPFGIIDIALGLLFFRFSGGSKLLAAGGILLAFLGCAFILTGYEKRSAQYEDQPQKIQFHSVVIFNFQRI